MLFALELRPPPTRPAGVPLKRMLAEFRVSRDALLPVGTELTAAHFVPGQYVDVAGTSIGKGFQGVMKRFNFAGGPASHGNSLAHRVPGSTGACQVRHCLLRAAPASRRDTARQLTREAPTPLAAGPRQGVQGQEAAGPDGRQAAHRAELSGLQGAQALGAMRG